MTKRLLVLFSILVFFWTAPDDIWAQSEMAGWFSPPMGFLKTTVHFEAIPYEKKETPSQSGKELQMTRYQASFLAPIVQDREKEWSLLANFRSQDIQTEAILPYTKRNFPDRLWDVRVGPLYRQRFQNRWFGGVFLTLGSASDRIFSDIDVMELQATFFLGIPDGERNAWIGFLTYSNNREFLNNLPLPGFGYRYEPSDQYRFFIGIPLAFADLRPHRKVRVEFSYLPMRSVRVKISYRFWGPLQVFGSFDWRNESYFLAARSEKRERFFYYEKRVVSGVRWEVTSQTFLELSLGYAFDRFYFEGRKYENRDRNRVEVDDGLLGSLRLGFRF